MNSGIYRETLHITKPIDVIGVPDPHFHSFVKRKQLAFDLVTQIKKQILSEEDKLNEQFEKKQRDENQNEDEHLQEQDTELYTPYSFPRSSLPLCRHFTASKAFLSHPYNDVIIQPPFNEGQTPIIISGLVALKVHSHTHILSHSLDTID